MTNEKFELLADQSITVFGITLFRIRARIAFGNVGKDELGGFVEKESNVDTSGNAWVYGNARVYGNAQVSGNARVYGNAWVSGNASLVWFSHVGSESSTLTAFRAKTGIEVTRGCFHGTIDEFAAAVETQHGTSQIGAEYRLLIEFIRLRFKDAAQQSEAA